MNTTMIPPVVDAPEPDAPPVDPRFRVRRLEVRRSARRRRRRIWWSIFAFVALVAIAVAVLASPLVGVSELAVSGSSHLTADEVRAASGLRVGEPMVLVAAGAATAGIEALPWVARARVVRRWPRRVELNIVERTPLAVLAIGAERWVVGEGGVVVAAATEADAQLLLVKMPESTRPDAGGRLSRSASLAVAMVAALPSSLRPRIVDAVISDRGEVVVNLNCGAEIDFGSPTFMERKFLAAETMLGGRVDLSGLKRLDVRVPGDPRIERGGSCR